MRLLFLFAATIIGGLACGASEKSPGRSGLPARLSFGRADTVIVNNVRPVRLSVSVLDSEGRLAADSGVRFTWVAGDSLALDDTGTVRCGRASDSRVRVRLASLSADALVLCRPVHHLWLSGPVQLRVGDNPERLPLQALDASHRPVHLLTGNVTMERDGVASVEGLTIRAQSPGASIVQVVVGDRKASTGVHVYALASTLDGIRRDSSFVAVPLQLASGEMRRWHLPPGGWMLTMLPEDDSTGLRIRIEGASCTDGSAFSKRRFLCHIPERGSVTVYNASSAARAALTGELLVRPLFSP